MAKLYIAGTPIGNLADITLRAIETLKDVAVIACEDTRRTRILLSKYGISAKLVSLHAHSGEAKIEAVLDIIEAGTDVAYVTDAGMPTLSDPGHELVKAAMERNIPVEVIPGVSALTTALAYAPFTSARFAYEGFLPRKGGERAGRLAEIAARQYPSVIFEAPGRVLKLLDDLSGVCSGGRRVLIARELTKRFEEIAVVELGRRRECDITVKGEFTIVIEGAKNETNPPDEHLKEWEGAVEAMRDAGMTGRDIISVLKALQPRAASVLRDRVIKNERS